jgi:transposase
MRRRPLSRSREMFIPLSHRPGQAQADFGEADGYIVGKKARFHYFCMDLPHSYGCFVKAYPAETAEAFCDGHVAAFAGSPCMRAATTRPSSFMRSPVIQSDELARI